MENQSVAKKWSKHLPVFPKISIGFDIFILILALLLYDLIKVFSVFGISDLWSFLSLVLKILGLLSIIYIVLQFKKKTWKTFVPLILNGITIWILFSSSYMNNIWDFRMRLELWANKYKYEEIIKKFENKELKSTDENGYIHLSPSPGDFIIVDKSDDITSIFFDIGTGFHNYNGFMYRSNDSQPPTTEFMGTFWLSCEHEELNWYYCSSN